MSDGGRNWWSSDFGSNKMFRREVKRVRMEMAVKVECVKHGSGSILFSGSEV